MVGALGGVLQALEVIAHAVAAGGIELEHQQANHHSQGAAQDHLLPIAAAQEEQQQPQDHDRRRGTHVRLGHDQAAGQAEDHDKGHQAKTEDVQPVLLGEQPECQVDDGGQLGQLGRLDRAIQQGGSKYYVGSWNGSGDKLQGRGKKIRIRS